ncbi:MAG: hypothetical protein ACTSX9_08545 [Candidatus Njordarchaeales archaeon]
MLGLTTFERIIKYLKLLGKNFEVDKKNNQIIVHEKMNGKEYRVLLGVTKGWVWMALKCASLEEIPEEYRGEIMFSLLRINNDYAEVSFGINKDGNILLREEILESALTLDIFIEEYEALLVGIDVFNKLLKEITSPVPQKEGK